MPEAQRDLDSQLVKSTMKQMNSTSYDRIPKQRNSNWSSSDSIDVTYIPLVGGAQYEDHQSSSSAKLSKPIQNVLAASEAKHFCCCSGEVRDFGSCWKTKRRQIIWESAHASAKNRTTTARRRRITTTATPTLSESLLPTLISTTTTKPFNLVNKPEVGVNKRKGGVSNISTSLPATPNLSHLQRRQYKKLSLECEEFVTGEKLQPPLQMSATQRLQSFAVANSCQTKQQAAKNIITTTADLHKQPPSMLLTHELIAVPATTIPTPTAIKFTACNAQLVAKNNNNNNTNSNSNRNNSQHGSLAAASDNNTTQSQAAIALLSHNSASLSATTMATTTTATTTTTANSSATKSSLAFCEHCCESISMLSSSSSSSNKNSNADRKVEAERFYGEDVDSVSDELSSFRLVSEEEISNNSNAFSVTRNKEQPKSEHEEEQEQATTHSPNRVVVEPHTANKQAVVVASTRSSSPVSTTKICCYTIGRASTHYIATDKQCNQSAQPSDPVPIPAAAAGLSGAAVDATTVELSDFFDAAGILSTSLPSNYGSAAVSSSSVNQVSSVKRKNAPPPTPPPKPSHRDQRVARHASARSNSQRALARLYYDPASFHRKLQKFEKQTASLSPADSATRSQDISESERAECSSPEACELLNCFGSTKSTQARERGVIVAQPFVARSSSDSSCCLPSAVGEKCIVHNNNNNVANAKLSASACAIDDKSSSEANNNYNCKILNVAAYNNRCQQQQHFSSSPALNKRTLRYDSCGRLKVDRFFPPNKPSNVSVVVQKSLSESRLPQSISSNKLTANLCRKTNLREAYISETPTNGWIAQTECLTSTPPVTPKSPQSPQSPLSPTATITLLQTPTELDRNFNTPPQQAQPTQSPAETQLFKSYSDTQNFVSPKKLAENSALQQYQQPTHQQQQRSFSENPLKCINYQPSLADIALDACKCAIATQPTSPTTVSIQRKNSVSLPSVPQNNGSESPLWLSSETIASSRCDLQRGSDDTQSICSDQTTIFHLEHDCSSSSSPSSQSCSGQVILRGPLLLKRIPEIQSFGHLPTYSQSLGNNANVPEQIEKELSMEKRRNTLDRFQRLGFGRKSSPNSAAAATNQENNQTKNRKSSEKSERLKELTELLRGNRSSPTPPPVPPPRKPRNGTQSASNSFEKSDKQTASVDDGKPLSFMSTQSDDIQLMDQEEPALDSAADVLQVKQENAIDPLARCATHHLHDTLKPNASLSNFESLMSGREHSKSPPPIIQVDSVLEVSSHIDSKLTRPESRTIIGSYTQKGIPFRSASFSQIDYSSGKYKKSALSLLRDRLRRDKAVDRSTSPTVAANIALTRNKEQLELDDTANGVVAAKKEPDWIYIPLKKTELSINLNYSSLHRSLEDVAESPDVLIEEEVFALEKEKIAEQKIDPLQTQVAHAKMESLTDTIHSENDYTIDEEHLPLTVESGNLTTTDGAASAANTIEVVQETHVESNLATLIEEDIPLESPPDNFLQTATTCLIPVPVYECAAQDWRLENPPQEWVEVASEEFGIIPETIEPIVSLEQCSVAQPESKIEPEPKNVADILPTISVSHSSEETDDADILRKKPLEENSDNEVMLRTQETVERRQASLDYPEVKKRYSQDDIEIGTEKRSSLDSIAARFSAEERKRIDKSRRRKGMYIESTDWSDGAVAANRTLALDITIANFNAIKRESPDECPNIMFLNSPMTDENRTPGSLYSLDLNTPESECSKPPVWTKSQGLSTFSSQSSEEKDDAQVIVGSSSDVAVTTSSVAEAPAVSLPRNNKSFPFLRTDSISDNESDRTPPPSRDRTSASPSLSDSDFKRFSKRPLRGPYGQMLEAEMKKPNRMHFEEILEELRESEGISSQPRRQRNVYEGRSHEEPIGIGGISTGGTGGAVRNMPQYSNSVRVRKTSTFLPVPSHARAASTPSQIENVISNNANSNTRNNDNSVEALNKVNPHDKRYQSTQDNAVTRDKHDASNSDVSQQQQQQQQQPPHKLQQQIYTHTQQQQQQQQHQHHLRDMKRAASEAPTTKSHHSKRSQSMSGEKPTHHQHQQKRSLDVSNKQKNASNLMPTQELLAELLKGSSEKLLSEQRQQMFADTRTHVVQEIFKNEQSYVESLQTVVMKYLKVLKSPEHAGMIDSRTVDEIFFMVPDILEIHEKFLAELRARLDNWDTQQKVGDAFMETFSKLEVLEVYTSFVNNCNRAKNAIRTTKHQRPSFAKFLETTAREHKGKLTLDNLLIKPVQKFPNYEMLFTRLIKHTDHDHPDQKHLQDVLKLVHDILVHINCKEREILENGQREATLRELEGVIEGITDLIAPDRQFLLFDLVSMPSGQGARKERGFFLFNDLLVLTSIKKRSGTIRKPNTTTCPGTVASTLDTNKYKFLTKISLDCLDIVKTKDENLKRIMAEIENLADDCNKLQQITEITASLRYPHQYLEDVIRELHRDVQRQLSERQTNDAQLNMLELTVSSPNGSQKLSIVFSKAEKRSQWEETFNEAKQKLAATLERHPIPEFLTSIPIRKTRAGLQFTCAAATLSEKRDVWVCNSDGYVGQVCIMSLHPEPNVTSCNGVCNARILCVASVPAYSGRDSGYQQSYHHQQQHHQHQHQHSDTHHQRDFRKSSSPNCQTPASALGAQNERRKPNSSSASLAAAAAGSSNINSSNSDIQLELNLSSSDEEVESGLGVAGSSSLSSDRVPSPAPSTHTNASTSTASTTVIGTHQQQDSNPDESEGNQSTMWIGTEDGCIHVYNSTDNIRIKKNRIKIEHHSAVYSILYLDNRVFVSLANGDICVYLRDGVGWNTNSSHCISLGTVSSPISKLLNVHGKLWCSIQGIIKVLDIETLVVVNQLQISSDSKPITNMTVCNNYVWISIQNSAHIKCFHSNSHQLITEVNLAPAVNKMLSNCDEIIRQHKAACLRVTSLLSCKDLIWIGTSAGVLLTIPAQGYEKGAQNVVPTGIPHGHTGHVRFLTFVETTGAQVNCSTSTLSTTSTTKDSDNAANELKGSSKHTKTKSETNNILIISGGDGYEDFRNSGANSLSEIAGREDSTNHLLIWQI